MQAQESPGKVESSGKRQKSSPRIVFTDPGALGHFNGRRGSSIFTATGDVDDTAHNLYMAQEERSNVTFYVCDDPSGERYFHYMSLIGNKMVELYGCEIKPELELTRAELSMGTIVHIHAPVSTATADYLLGQAGNITHVFTQGESSQRANFKPAPRMWEVLQASPFKGKTTLYSSDGTNFTMPKDNDFLGTLIPEAKLIYEDYFDFMFRKTFGTAAGNKQFNDMLYSETGFVVQDTGTRRPGNGIYRFKPLIEELRTPGNEEEPPKMPVRDREEMRKALGDKLFDATLRTYYETGNTDETSVDNLLDLVWLLNQYCDYATLLVDGKLPDMSRLGLIKKKDGCPKEIEEAFAVTTSTPLFDFAAGKFALEEKPANLQKLSNDPVLVDQLIHAVKMSLATFSKDCVDFAQRAPGSKAGGGKSKRNRKSNKRKSKKRKSRRSRSKPYMY